MGTMFLDGVARAQGSSVAAGTQKGTGDPIDAHLLREATRHAKALVQRDARTQHAAVVGMASNLRLHAAQVRATNIEPALARALSQQVARRGRDGFLDDVTGPEAMQRHDDQLRALGLEDLHVADREIPRDRYNQMITTLSTPGALAVILVQSADALDAMGTHIVAGRLSVDAHVAKVQDIFGWCSTMTTVCQFMKEAVAIICALSAAGFPEFFPICAVMGVEAATACFLAWACGG